MATTAATAPTQQGSEEIIRQAEENLNKRLPSGIKAKVIGVDEIRITPAKAYWMQHGRRAGKQPPLDDIARWCRDNRIPSEAAYPIARKIGREGTQGKETYLEAVKETAGDIIRLLWAQIQ